MTIKKALEILNAATNDLERVKTLAQAKTIAFDALRAIALLPPIVEGYAVGAAVQDTATDVSAVKGAIYGVSYYLNRLSDKLAYIATF